MTGATIGTVAYMSPEQAKGTEVDHRSDIWSLGVVLYEIVHEEPEPIEAKRPDAPKGLGRIVEKALSKDPKDRYQSMRELREDLEQVCKAPSSGRRHAVRLVGIGIAIAAVIAAGLWFSHHRGESERQAATQGMTAGEKVESFSILVAPFWGPTAEAMDEGRLMKALIESKLDSLAESEAAIRVVSRDVKKTVRTHDKARQLGTSKKAAEIANVALLMVGSYYEYADPPKALSILQKIQPPLVEGLQIQAAICNLTGDSQAAVAAIKKALVADYSNAYSHYLLARTYHDSDQYELAEPEYRKAMELDPYSISFPIMLGNLYYESGRYDEIQPLLDAAISRTKTEDFEDNFRMGTAFYMLRDFNKALEHFERAASLEPDYWKPFLDSDNKSNWLPILRIVTRPFASILATSSLARAL